MEQHELDTIERDNKRIHDIRIDATNERKSIYEITAFKNYLFIHKKDGHILNISSAQNALCLVLKYF